MIFGETIESLKPKDFSNKEFSNCVFINCEFIGSNFKNSKFKNCKFKECNLTLIKNSKTTFEKIEFVESKIIGINFSRFDQEKISLNFKNCFIKQCSFENMQLPGIKFVSCEFEGVDFEYSNLKNANFRGSSFKDTFFKSCDLTESIFLKSKGFFIDPSENNLDKARFSKDNLYGLLKSFGIRVGGK